MSDRAFIDSNVWVYAFMTGDDKRIAAANQLIEQTKAIQLSTQVVNEVCSVLLRKHRVTDNAITDYIDYFYDEFPVATLDEGVIRYASSLRIRHAFSFWDSLIAATAIENSCATLYSEDMQHEMVVAGTRIINPFRNLNDD